ncbi:M23 family metallopeptidase [Candidatus Fermentibacteria bacterium]|nr:M23 family metallopeptidase [Candidatus Fermentibacteria bacterium]
MLVPSGSSLGIGGIGLLLAVNLASSSGGGDPQHTADERPWPLSFPTKVTSTFGEYRRDHFHAGIDLSTYGTSGHVLTAVGSGSVWRVRVDPRGYGRTLSLRLDDGHIVTYAHMKRFAPQVEAVVREMQDELGHCMVDFFLEPHRVRVARGDAVGRSGGTGAGPPHLHMEVHSPEGEAINPLLHWYAVPDTVAPTVYRLVLSPLTATASINGRSKPLSVRVRKVSGSDRWEALGSLQVWGEIGVAVRARDRINNGGDQVGLYRLQTFIDGEEIFRREYDSFPEAQFRLLHLVYDADLLRRGFGRCERLYRLPGDHLSFHDNSPGDGVIRAGLGGLDYGAHTVEIQLGDIAGNCATITLPLTVNHPPEIVGLTWVSEDTLEVDIGDEEPGSCVLSFSQKKGGRWAGLESRALGGRRWHVRRPAPGVLLSVLAKDTLGAASKPFFRGDPGTDASIVHVDASHELVDGYVRIILTSSHDLSQAPHAFVAPGGLGYSRAVMRADDERTYSMDLLLFPQASPGFRIIFMVDCLEGGSGRAELFVPVAPLAMDGQSSVSSDDGVAWLSSGPDAVFSDLYVKVDAQVLHPPSAMAPLSIGYQFSPENAPLKRPVVIGITLPDGSEDIRGVGMFRWDHESGYHFVPSTRDEVSRAMVGSTDRLGTFVLLHDPEAPEVSLLYGDRAVINRNKAVIRAQVRDRGSGVDPASVQMHIDGVPVPACPEGITWIHRATKGLERGEHLIRITAHDRVGNESSAEVRVIAR